MINEMYLATRTRPETPQPANVPTPGSSPTTENSTPVPQSCRPASRRCRGEEEVQPGTTTPSSESNELLPKVLEFMTSIVDKLLSTVSQLSEKLAQAVTPPAIAENPAKSETTAPSGTTSPTGATTPTTGTTQPAEAEPASSTAKTTDLRKTGQFLWKPISEKDGKVAVLLPENLKGKVARVRILDKDGKTVLGNGHYSGVGNGDREHYRFNKTGSKYPAGAIVDIELKTGAHRQVTIESPGQRVTR